MQISSHLDILIAVGLTTYLIKNRPPITSLSLTGNQFHGLVVSNLTVSISTFKIKYFAQTEATCEAVWICGLLRKLEVLKIIEKNDYLKTVSSSICIFANN